MIKNVQLTVPVAHLQGPLHVFSEDRHAVAFAVYFDFFHAESACDGGCDGWMGVA